MWFVVDNMSLLQYGVTDDSRVILSVKDTDTNAASSTSAAGDVAGCCSKQPELNSELMSLLLRHFTPADAERVAEEFKQVNTVALFAVATSDTATSTNSFNDP